MSVGTRIFDNFKEANIYAKAIALGIGKSPVVRRLDDKFEVYGEGVNPTEKSTFDLNFARKRLSEINSLLEDSTQESQIKISIKKFLGEYGNSHNLAKSLFLVEEFNLYERLEDIDLAIDEFIELLEEANPRSRGEADYYSKRCILIAEQLKPYKVSKRVLKEAREFSELSIKLPSVDFDHQNWLQKISILNTSGPTCRFCTHESRMRIVGERGLELWKCSANNHGTRFLTGEQRKFLADL